MSTPEVVADGPAPDVLDEVNQLINALQSHADPDVGAQVEALLERIDNVHRLALTHLMDGIRGMAGDAFVNRLVGDPAIRLLLMSYDLISVDRRLLAEEALDAVRGHLHAHGVDVELLEVVGSAVYVHLHGIEQAGLPLDAVRRDLEAALADGLIGFQQLELRAREKASGSLVQLGHARKARRPVYRAVGPAGDLPAGALRAVMVDEVPILLVNVKGEVYAVSNHCGDSPLPLEFSDLDGATLRCSWHGCLYDVRNGQRIDRDDTPLAVYPVSSDGQQILVALSTEEVR